MMPTYEEQILNKVVVLSQMTQLELQEYENHMQQLFEITNLTDDELIMRINDIDIPVNDGPGYRYTNTESYEMSRVVDGICSLLNWDYIISEMSCKIRPQIENKKPCNAIDIFEKFLETLRYTFPQFTDGGTLANIKNYIDNFTIIDIQDAFTTYIIEKRLGEYETYILTDCFANINIDNILSQSVKSFTDNISKQVTRIEINIDWIHTNTDKQLQLITHIKMQQLTYQCLLVYNNNDNNINEDILLSTCSNIGKMDKNIYIYNPNGPYFIEDEFETFLISVIDLDIQVNNDLSMELPDNFVYFYIIMNDVSSYESMCMLVQPIDVMRYIHNSQHIFHTDRSITKKYMVQIKNLTDSIS